MGKPGGNDPARARQRVAAQREAARRAERRNRLLIASAAVAVVAAIIVAFVIARTAGGGPSTPVASPAGTPLPASVSSAVTGVPAGTLDAVGAGSVPAYLSRTGQRQAIAGTPGPPLTAGGKPEMLYIGAEFCPYCAAMRWSMAVALSRFGTLSPLRGIYSAPSPEIYPSTATLTFYKSSYTSAHLVFTPVENEKVDHSPLQPVTPQQRAVWEKYTAGSYPFIDIGGRYLAAVSYDPGVLAGRTWAQIAAALHDPASPIARGVLGAANYLTAAICKVTGQAPASVCSSPVIASLQRQF